MNRKKRFFAIITIITLVLVCFQSNALGVIDTADQAMPQTRFEANDVKNALLLSANNRSSIDLLILDKVLLPTSMGIDIPKIDPSKVTDRNDKLLNEYACFQDFYDALAEHGIPEEVSAKMTMSQYLQIESTWELDEEILETALKLYPELENQDINSWTIGDYQAYVKTENINDLRKRFSESQLLELEERDILIEDTFYLFKEYHTPETILRKTNAEIKSVLEDYYTFNFDYVLGAGSMEQWISARNDEGMEIMSSPTYNLSEEAEGHYTWVDFPKYGADYFHNDVLTNAYWRDIQAYRTLLTQCSIYAMLYSTDRTLHCTNMYGTYSRSQGGAHEGIDFAYGEYRYLYCPVEGISLSIPTTNSNRDHQLSIYDANHPDGAKTYSFLHMSEKSTATSFTVADWFGVQGDEGNADGIHLHFEVHSGRTTNLSSGSDQVVGSISPYRLTEYIGEAILPS